MSDQSFTMGAKDKRARSVELLISNLLRIGVFSSILVILAGTVIGFVHHPDYLSQPPALERLTKPGAAFPRTVSEIMSGLREGRGQAVIIVGLLLLIATPVMRVAISILGFIYERDARYVIITSIVLVLLIIAFALGKAEG